MRIIKNSSDAAFFFETYLIFTSISGHNTGTVDIYGAMPLTVQIRRSMEINPCPKNYNFRSIWISREDHW